MITIPVDTFRRAVSVCQPFVPTRTTKSELTYIKMACDSESMSLVASDGESAIQHSESLSGQSGSAMLPQRLSLVLDESNQDDVGLEMDASGVLVIHDGPNEYRLLTIPVKDYPKRELSTHSEDAVTIARASLLTGLSIAAIAAEDGGSARYALGGVRIEFHDGRLTFVASDSRRISIVECSAAGEVALECSIPLAHVKRLVSSLSALSSQSVHVRSAGSTVEFVSDQTAISCPILAGIFPPWRKIMPAASPSPAIATCGHLASIVRQARLGRQEGETAVRFLFSSGGLTLQSGTAKHGSHVDLPISYDGGDVSVYLNPDYVLGWLGKMNSEDSIEWHLKDGESAVMLMCPQRDATYVLMPLERRDAK